MYKLPIEDDETIIQSERYIEYMQWKNEVLKEIEYDPIKGDWIYELETPDSLE